MKNKEAIQKLKAIKQEINEIIDDLQKDGGVTTQGDPPVKPPGGCGAGKVWDPVLGCIPDPG
jgi:hypothetical protein